MTAGDGVLNTPRDSNDPNSSTDINTVAKDQNIRNIAIDWNQVATVTVEIAGLVAGNIADITNLSIKNVRVKSSSSAGPVGADLIFDVNINGVTIFTDQDNRPKILDGAESGVSGTPDIKTLTENDLITVDCDQIGSGTPGGAHIYITISLQ